MILFIHNFVARQKTINKVFVFVLYSISIMNTSAQSLNDDFYFTKVLRTTNNFQEIENQVENYYSDRDTGKGSGYKQWKRWQHFYKNRLMKDGTVPNLGAVEMQEVKKSELFQKKKNAYAKNAQTTGNWTNIDLDRYQRFGRGYNGGLGRINCIAVDPDNEDIIYVGTPAGGLWRSTTGGNSWEPLTDNLLSIGISGIAIDYSSPANNRTIYILTGDGDGRHTESIGVLKSIDNGATWENTGLTWGVRDNKYGYKIVINPMDSNILMVATDDGVYRSTDAGKTWVLVLKAFKTYDIEFKPRSRTVYASASGSFFKSTDGGVKWKEIQGISGSGRTAIAVTSKRASVVYLLFGSIKGNGQFGGMIDLEEITDHRVIMTWLLLYLQQMLMKSILEELTVGNQQTAEQLGRIHHIGEKIS